MIWSWSTLENGLCSMKVGKLAFTSLFKTRQKKPWLSLAMGLISFGKLVIRQL